MTITAQTAPAGQQETVPCHWVVTLQWQVGASGFAANTLSGSADIAPGMSRGDLFASTVDYARGMAGLPAGTAVSVLFYLLEPDQVEAGSAGALR